MYGKRKRQATGATHYRSRKTTVETDGSITQSNITLSAPGVVRDKARRIQQTQARHEG